MDISIRNGKVLENILPYVDDATTVMRLSAVCKRWYELLNTDTILWNRLLNLEQIEDPQYWNRTDDNDEWTLGTPCTPKNILINYRKTYYYIKHNIYKKYEFECDNNNVFEYDGKTLMFTKDWVLQIYKIINNNLQLFQTIGLSRVPQYLEDFVMTNSEFIVIFCIGKMITYRLKDNKKYVHYNQWSFDDIGTWLIAEPKQVLDSNILIGNLFGDCVFKMVAWNIPDKRIIFNAADNTFIKHDRGIIYAGDNLLKKIVLYNERFELIYRINQKFEAINEIISNNNLLVIRDLIRDLCNGITVYDKATGQFRIGFKTFEIDSTPQILLLNNNNIILMNPYRRNPLIQCFNARLQQLWSHRLQSDVIDSSLELHYIFNKLLIIKKRKESRNCIIEFRDISNGDVLSTIHIHTDLINSILFNFNKDTFIFGPSKKSLRDSLFHRMNQISIVRTILKY
ncbi:hypothetical protein O3M35_010957 [Rhynocoris fuscipes]|uniref:F-box domain-containing protein n=1 Tax=Rhynocoris fuscipes TaxID=488301 RepID=A0AAW1D3P0_9HEMI